MSTPRFIASGLLIVVSLFAFVIAMPSTQAASSSSAGTSATVAPVAEKSAPAATASIGESADLPLWLVPAGFVVMLAGIAVVGTARRGSAFAVA